MEWCGWSVAPLFLASIVGSSCSGVTTILIWVGVTPSDILENCVILSTGSFPWARTWISPNSLYSISFSDLACKLGGLLLYILYLPIEAHYGSMCTVYESPAYLLHQAFNLRFSFYSLESESSNGFKFHPQIFRLSLRSPCCHLALCYGHWTLTEVADPR